MVTITLTDVDQSQLKKQQWTLDELLEFVFMHKIAEKYDWNQEDFSDSQVEKLEQLPSNKKLDLLLEKKFGVGK